MTFYIYIYIPFLWDLWYYTILGSCRILSINSIRVSFGDLRWAPEQVRQQGICKGPIRRSHKAPIRLFAEETYTGSMRLCVDVYGRLRNV